MAARHLVAALALAVGVAWLGSPAVWAASPSPSPNAIGNCDRLPSHDLTSYAGRVGCTAGQIAGQANQAVSNAVGLPGRAAASAAETEFTSWLAGGAAWVVEGVMQQVVGSSTTPSLDPAQAASFAQAYGRVVGVALSLSVLLVLIGIIEATLTQRPGALRRVVVGIAVSGIGLGAIPAATAILVRVTDDLSAYVAAGPSQGVAVALKALVQMLLQTDPAQGAAAFALAALGMMVGGALLWLELVVRESLIYVFLGVAPLACAAVQWPRLEGVLRQVLFGGLALILSKLVIAIVLVVGFAVLSLGTGLQGLLGGMFILLIAALTPFATARVLPLAAEEMALGHQGRMRGWAAAGVGTTARLAAAASSGGASAAAGGLGLAPPMGSSSSPGPSSGPPGPGPADGGGGPGGHSGPGRPAPGKPRAAQQVATAASGPGPSHQGPAGPPEPPPRPGPRGPEPPRNAGRPPVK